MLAHRAAMRALLVRHQRADGQWLAGDLHHRAAEGDRRARRLLAHLYVTLKGWGVKVHEPTWERVTSPERRHELDA